ncbi:hypothetical protein TNCV_1766181 [Trichonephila clavipes]|nr:hypothetical protein TNCV_1766181 [Trichonephila clavipes]
MVYGRKAEKSPLFKRRTRDKQSHMADFSPAFNRKFYSNASVIPLPSLSRQSSTETTVSDTTPPNSPSSSRKAREDSNVFSRLTSGSFRLNKPGRKTPKETYVMLVCVYEGQALSKKCVYDWFDGFREGQESVSDNLDSKDCQGCHCP